MEALLERSRRKPNLRNRVDPVVEDAVLKHAIDEPAHRQTRTSNELRKVGVCVSPNHRITESPNAIGNFDRWQENLAAEECSLNFI